MEIKMEELLGVSIAVYCSSISFQMSSNIVQWICGQQMTGAGVGGGAG
jgi:hypothetical protein